ncbi:hypothetical protein Hamer_G024380 [Homarus americanus]|uniref:Uncharacterized protein n=1 Tax=Homarus americanus TaxID=6706 RepID=A0A8J5JLF7_HOMAM|nr:hypothetical protein Hamer_G024380 [Homarus americanus]
MGPGEGGRVRRGV